MEFTPINTPSPATCSSGKDSCVYSKNTAFVHNLSYKTPLRSVDGAAIVWKFRRRYMEGRFFEEACAHFGVEPNEKAIWEIEKFVNEEQWPNCPQGRYYGKLLRQDNGKEYYFTCANGEGWVSRDDSGSWADYLVLRGGHGVQVWPIDDVKEEEDWSSSSLKQAPSSNASDLVENAEGTKEVLFNIPPAQTPSSVVPVEAKDDPKTAPTIVFIDLTELSYTDQVLFRLVDLSLSWAEINWYYNEATGKKSKLLTLINRRDYVVELVRTRKYHKGEVLKEHTRSDKKNTPVGLDQTYRRLASTEESDGRKQIATTSTAMRLSAFVGRLQRFDFS
ncbi:hypothetical protein NHQ30_008214 [Ciborinia camelliae]|nr:hypothetical protein NHQ30_008214 [Ciborinia camelliae]